MAAIKLFASLFYNLELKWCPKTWDHLSKHLLLWARLCCFSHPYTRWSKKHCLILQSLCSPVYVVELDWYPDSPGEMVVLTCDTPEENGITWTSDQSNEVLGSGKTLTIQVKEFGDAGQYTCHKGGKVLSHSLLLLHKKEDGIWSTDILKDQKGNSIPLGSINFLFCSIRDKKIKNLKGKTWLV